MDVFDTFGAYSKQIDSILNTMKQRRLMDLEEAQEGRRQAMEARQAKLFDFNFKKAEEERDLEKGMEGTLAQNEILAAQPENMSYDLPTNVKAPLPKVPTLRSDKYDPMVVAVNYMKSRGKHLEATKLAMEHSKFLSSQGDLEGSAEFIRKTIPGANPQVMGEIVKLTDRLAVDRRTNKLIQLPNVMSQEELQQQILLKQAGNTSSMSNPELTWLASQRGPDGKPTAASLQAQDALVRGERLAQAGRSTYGMDVDPKEIADEIEAGRQEPTLKGMYRYGAAVRTALGRKDYNLVQAQLDLEAIKKHIATMNGAKQVALRQAVDFTYESLDVIEGLYKEWKATGLPSGFKDFNKVALSVASKLPGKSGAIASTLLGQINDLTAELGTVYKGGNSSTDDTLRLAGENLKGEWNTETFAKAMEQIRKNLKIRKNSYTLSVPFGMSSASPYAKGRYKALLDEEAKGGGAGGGSSNSEVPWWAK